MIRLLPDGILIGYNVAAIWLLLPVPGTLLGMFVWYIVRYVWELRHPVERRLKAAVASREETIDKLKARILDEVDARRAAEIHRNELRIKRVVGA